MATMLLLSRLLLGLLAVAAFAQIPSTPHQSDVHHALHASPEVFLMGLETATTLRPLCGGAKYRVKRKEFLYGTTTSGSGPRRSTYNLGVKPVVTHEAGDFNRCEIIAIAATRAFFLHAPRAKKRGRPTFLRPRPNPTLLKRNWDGDPCVPQKFTCWEGPGMQRQWPLNTGGLTRCENLSPIAGLGGGIPPFIASLTSLTSLGSIYNNFSEISSTNNFEWDYSKDSFQKDYRVDALLRLAVHPWINNNPILCSTVSLCESTTTTQQQKQRKKIIIPIAIAISAFVSYFGIYRIIQGATRKGWWRQLVEKENRLLSESDQFSISDVVNITNNFERPIGRGSFGIVYYGRLKDETQVAVKVLSISSTQGTQHFRAESSYNNQLHTGGSAHHNTLSWRGRLRIALEAAQGLDYLHCGCKPPIVHRDVKPSNILLNENFEVKLADFGLSRAFTNEEATHISTLIAGTPGYLDPEYFRTNRLNEKTDVYSFGIVLLELVTGKPPIGNDSQRTHTTRHVQSRLERGDIADIADQRMQGYYDVNSIWKVLEIAMSCTSRSSGERPTISTVVIQLKGLCGSSPFNARISPSAR
ncbi:unnamed protein product [Spirodela intermedia]|uniref:Protein kinase domain-containing protein n=1 Tax=Spirodela intermedia TaxID=51605 RepID=A0ABN7EE96_SPIIN|nr:unnamed protein product [Spirodela intermedia]